MSSALDRLAVRAKSNTPSLALGGREIEVPIAKIRFDPAQPRKAYHSLDGKVAEKDEDYIKELAATIKARGLIQAITVQEMDDGSYMVVVGECRTRAHVLLELPTIRAVVRNDLVNIGQRLLYQIAENVNRQNLTDDELALAVRALMKGENGLEPMSQVEIAKTLGKAEGWVSRLVRFGDEELQRLWVKTGIVDSVENLYRLSILPQGIQVDILRRVDLPIGHVDRLEKPLDRKVIDAFSREAKIHKKVGMLNADTPKAPAPVAPGVSNVLQATGRAETGVAGIVAEDTVMATTQGVDQRLRDGGVALGVDVAPGAALGAAGDDVGQTLGELVMGNYDRASPAVGSSAPSKYVLPAEDRAKILGIVESDFGDKGGGVSSGAVMAPVNYRMSMMDVVALLSTVTTNSELHTELEKVLCQISIPGSVAQKLANELAGVMVDHKEVPATIQAKLKTLH